MPLRKEVSDFWLVILKYTHLFARMVPIHPYYLGATPSAPISSATFSRPQSMSQATLPSPASHVTSPTGRAAARQSMPPPSRTAASPPSQPVIRPIEPTPEEGADSETDEDDKEAAGRARKGTMSRNFRFPSPSADAPPPPLPDIPPTVPKHDTPSSPRIPAHTSSDTEEIALTPVIAQSVEMPPPPPVEKERSPIAADIGDEEVGDTEEISLN